MDLMARSTASRSVSHCIIVYNSQPEVNEHHKRNNHDDEGKEKLDALTSFRKIFLTTCQRTDTVAIDTEPVPRSWTAS